jgi:hypothetical protein
LPFCHFEARAARTKSERYPNELNTLGDHIRARRIDHGIYQSSVATLIGVHELAKFGVIYGPASYARAFFDEATG